MRAIRGLQPSHTRLQVQSGGCSARQNALFGLWYKAVQQVTLAAQGSTGLDCKARGCAVGSWPPGLPLGWMPSLACSTRQYSRLLLPAVQGSAACYFGVEVLPVVQLVAGRWACLWRPQDALLGLRYRYWNAEQVLEANACTQQAVQRVKEVTRGAGGCWLCHCHPGLSLCRHLHREPSFGAPMSSSSQPVLACQSLWRPMLALPATCACLACCTSLPCLLPRYLAAQACTCLACCTSLPGLLQGPVC